jgi:hypothetical protein
VYNCPKEIASYLAMTRRGIFTTIMVTIFCQKSNKQPLIIRHLLNIHSVHGREREHLLKYTLRLFNGFFQVYAFIQNPFKQVAFLFKARDGIVDGKMFHSEAGFYLVPM